MFGLCNEQNGICAQRLQTYVPSFSRSFGHGAQNMETSLATLQLHVYASNGDCREQDMYFCATWGFETLASWDITKDDYIPLQRVESQSKKKLRKITPIQIKIRNELSNIQDPRKTWVLCLYALVMTLG